MHRKLLLFFTILIKFSNALNLICDFDYINTNSSALKIVANSGTNYYCCHLRNLTVTTRNVQVTSILGSHTENFEDSDVQWISIESSVVNFLPHGFENFFENVQFLAVDNISLLELRKEDLRQFPNLRFLFANDNHLVELEEKIFDFNLKLEFIEFKRNKLKYVDYRIAKRVDSRNTNVKSFSYNFMENICLESFGFFSLGLNYAKNFENCTHEDEILCEYENSSCKVKNAQEFLMIEKTKIIGEFDGDGHNDIKITKVSILNSNFTKIPEIFGTKFRNLEIFGIRGNIEYLCAEDLEQFKKLRKLNLSGNKIKSLSSDVFVFNPYLEVIDISINKISKIGILTFSILENLKILDLNYNEAIDENFKCKTEIENAECIKQICTNDIVECRYSVTSFRYSGSLYYCNIINPPLSHDMEYSVYNHVYLQKIHGFSGHHFANQSNENVEALVAKFTNSTALDPRVSYHFPNLKAIHITKSDLMYLHENNFHGLQNLQVVDFSDNKISEVPNRIFEKNKELIFVDFSRNKILEIHEIFGSFHNLQAFLVRKNFPYLDFEISRRSLEYHEYIEDDKIRTNSNEDNEKISLFDKKNSIIFDFRGQPQMYEENFTEKLIEIPGVTFNCRYLESDYFRRVNTTCADKNVEQITKLRRLAAVTTKYDTKFITQLILHSEIMYFLPTNISNFFPNLKFLTAERKIKKIFRVNFEKLTKLEQIHLDENEIEFIDDDNIFQDNPNLKLISLKQNKIKKISGNVFVNLVHLRIINLSRNDCTAGNFHRITGSKSTSNLKVVDDVCGAKLQKTFIDFRINF